MVAITLLKEDITQMVSIEKIDDKLDIEFIECLKCALHKNTYNKPFLDEKKLFYNAINQGLPAIMVNGINKDLVSKQLYEVFQKHTFLFIHKDLRQQNLIEQLITIFNDINIRFVFLKGTILKPLYDETFMRGMGDIDVLVDRDKLDLIEKTFKKRGFKIYAKSPQHDVYETKDGLLVEVHPTLYSDAHDAYSNFFSNAIDYATFDNNYGRLEPNYELVYLVYHLAKHFRTSGIGLRSLLDISVYINHFEKVIHKKILDSYLEKTNLTTFFNTIMFLNYQYFGYRHYLYEDDFMDQDLFNQITEHLMSSGIHGKGTDFNFMAPRVAIEEKPNRIKIFFRLLFPKFYQMKSMYPVLKKWPILLPFMYIYRIIKKIFSKRSRKATKELIVAKQAANTMAGMFDKIGLR